MYTLYHEPWTSYQFYPPFPIQNSSFPVHSSSVEGAYDLLLLCINNYQKSKKNEYAYCYSSQKQIITKP